MASTPTTSGAVEIILFRPRNGVTDTQIVDAAEALERDLVKFPGYLGRRLLKDQDGQWIEIVNWRSLHEAVASQAIIEQPSAVAFDALVDMATVKMLHFTPVRSFESDSA